MLANYLQCLQRLQALSTNTYFARGVYPRAKLWVLRTIKLFANLQSYIGASIFLQAFFHRAVSQNACKLLAMLANCKHFASISRERPQTAKCLQCLQSFQGVG